MSESNPKEPAYTYRAVVTRVVDGDTIDVDLDLGCHVWIHRRLRFLEVNAWETRGEERDRGLAAKAFVEKAIADADRVIVQTEMDAEGKYGRLLAWVHLITADGNSSCLNKALIDEGHGR
jgi:micrococcal nuclease